MIVTYGIEKDFKIPKDAVAYQVSNGVINGKAVSIKYKKVCEGDNCAQSGDFLEGRVLGFLGSMIGQEEIVELNTVYRQDERRFINLLDAIRLNHMDYDDLMELNERHVPLPEDREYFITLTSRNAIADQINQIEINKLTTEPFSFQGVVTGEFNPRLFPSDPVLQVKRGAQVMFVKNDPQKRFVNGTIGKIQDVQHDKIIVSVPDQHENEQVFELERLEWEILKYKPDEKNPSKISTEIAGTFKQFPIKLAWAITIHKSQGKTFDRVIIDLGSGAFAYGQTYVALNIMDIEEYTDPDGEPFLLISNHGGISKSTDGGETFFNIGLSGLNVSQYYSIYMPDTDDYKEMKCSSFVDLTNTEQPSH
eukprot:snap_masked-scaffold2018_size22553-processed-gene-0.0 protein:Tk09017 transcript:snap_masked-scaffold2018_size22553-processed-gene-0.0-mRNA-1 annotation:"hypothetical protein"